MTRASMQAALGLHGTGPEGTGPVDRGRAIGTENQVKGIEADGPDRFTTSGTQNKETFSRLQWLSRSSGEVAHSNNVVGS